MMEHYAEVYPDAPSIIFSMAQSQSQHRQHSESKQLHHSIIRAYAGVFSGLVVAIAGLIAASYIAVNASAIAGTIVGGLDLVGLVGVFIYGTRQIQEDRRSKRPDEPTERQESLF